jgi:hypothetical protein
VKYFLLTARELFPALRGEDPGDRAAGHSRRSQHVVLCLLAEKPDWQVPALLSWLSWDVPMNGGSFQVQNVLA